MASGAGTVLLVQNRVQLDWSAPKHWDQRCALPCRVCDTNTHMRDDKGEPCHQSCAEQELAAKLAATRGDQSVGERGEVLVP